MLLLQILRNYTVQNFNSGERAREAVVVVEVHFLLMAKRLAELLLLEQRHFETLLSDLQQDAGRLRGGSFHARRPHAVLGSTGIAALRFVSPQGKALVSIIIDRAGIHIDGKPRFYAEIAPMAQGLPALPPQEPHLAFYWEGVTTFKDKADLLRYLESIDFDKAVPDAFFAEEYPVPEQPQQPVS